MRVGRSKRSKARGSALIFSISLVVLSVGFLLLALAYTRILSSQQEQTSAIGAAALAAAKDLSRVFIDDPNFGYVALCDQAPSGSAVAAADGYGLPVRGINTLLGTIRLQMIIADRLNNDTMKQAAANDYKNAVAASKRLEQALTKAVSEKTSSLTDASGKPIDFYTDVIEAYNNNAIRSNGHSELVTSSLKLILGYGQNALTNTPVPSPSSLDPQLPTSATTQRVYKANQAIGYNNYTFVFSGLSGGTNLINNDNFQTALKNLPYSLPSAIKVEAQQKFAGGKGTYFILAQACAQAGGAAFTCPAPGSLIFSFPDGCPSELSTPKSLTLENGVMTSRTTPYVNNGDYPLAGLTSTHSSTTLPAFVGTGLSDTISFSIYMWSKRAGPSLNIQDFLNMMSTAILPANSLNLPLMAAYSFNPTTGVIQKQINYLTNIYSAGSDKQIGILSASSMAFASTVSAYDVAISANIFQPGKTKGGNHGGEPLVDPRLIGPPFIPGGAPPPQPKLQPVPWDNYVSPCWSGPSGGWAFTAWKLGFRNYTQYVGGDNTPAVIFTQPTAANIGDLRPSYSTNGNAVEIALHKISNSVVVAPQ